MYSYGDLTISSLEIASTRRLRLGLPERERDFCLYTRPFGRTRCCSTGQERQKLEYIMQLRNRPVLELQRSRLNKGRVLKLCHNK